MPQQKPESILLATHLWLWVVGLEIVRIVFITAVTVITPSESFKGFREAFKQNKVDEAYLDTAATMMVVVVGLFSIAIMCMVLWMALVLSRGGKFAEFARRGLFIFGIYLGIRMLIPFMVSQPTIGPIWYLIDGCLHIAVGVCASMAVYLVSRPDAFEWTGEKRG
ncbi:MAG: hypothetical protein Q4A92_06420 [Corynebacterium sp.]|nr:hypothetical protein [Corynebacterium sp.]